jgi:hypothetical protein
MSTSIGVAINLSRLSCLRNVRPTVHTRAQPGCRINNLPAEARLACSLCAFRLETRFGISNYEIAILRRDA